MQPAGRQSAEPVNIVSAVVRESRPVHWSISHSFLDSPYRISVMFLPLFCRAGCTSFLGILLFHITF